MDVKVELVEFQSMHGDPSFLRSIVMNCKVHGLPRYIEDGISSSGSIFILLGNPDCLSD